MRNFAKQTTNITNALMISYWLQCKSTGVSSFWFGSSWNVLPAEFQFDSERHQPLTHSCITHMHSVACRFRSEDNDQPPARTWLWNFHYFFPSKRRTAAVTLHHGSSRHLGRRSTNGPTAFSVSVRLREAIVASLQAPSFSLAAHNPV